MSKPKPKPADTRVREQRSLFGEILDWMLAPLLLLWPMSVVLTRSEERRVGKECA